MVRCQAKLLQNIEARIQMAREGLRQRGLLRGNVLDSDIHSIQLELMETAGRCPHPQYLESLAGHGDGALVVLLDQGGYVHGIQINKEMTHCRGLFVRRVVLALPAAQRYDTN